MIWKRIYSLPVSLVLGLFLQTAFSIDVELSLAAGVASADHPPVDYLEQVRPILSDACYACHGPDEASREADLRLDQLSGVIGSNSEEGKVVVAGAPSESELYRRISSGDPDLVMPPKDSLKSLSAGQIEIIRRWIAEGAKWQQHWAFVTPQRPELPAVPDAAWPENSIDSFIAARLKQNGLVPSPEAEREVLIRRVTLDLTGLPPTLDELDAFLADPSLDAYERVVDRLLASPRYGEHMARYWLDAARYGDTHGLHLDNYREMWPYRDWVISAFNRNLSYDQFVIEQLAGDLMPDPKLEQLVATGFCRAHVSTNEGGSIEEEVHVRNVVDRTSTVGTVFLGLTIGCAVCHDHKFDPVSQQEFYQLFAFFNSLDGPALDGNIKDPAPVVNVPSTEQASRLATLREQVEDSRQQRTARKDRDNSGFQKWVKDRLANATSEPDPELYVQDQLVVHCDFDHDSGDQVINRANPEIPGKLSGAIRVEGRLGTGIQFPEGAEVNLGQVADFEDEDCFSYGAWVKTNNTRNSVVLAKSNPRQLHRGYELALEDGQVKALLSRRRPGYVIKVVSKKPLIQPNEWHHVFVTYDGSKRASGLVIYVDGAPQDVDVWSDALRFKDGISNSAPLRLGRRDEESHFPEGVVDDVRVYAKRLTEAEVYAIYLESQMSFLAEIPESEWSDEQFEILQHFYFMQHDGEFIACSERLDGLLNQLREIEQAVPTTLVFRESLSPRPAHLLIRGEYDKPGQEVPRDTPAALPTMPKDLPKDRLGLARWLVSPDQPLTSRVAVNRFWQQLFGTGLVKTSEDFGNQGSVPSHPLLLDWLAVEFREGGWDIKHLMKQMVMSATYRQSSHVTPELVAKDPENRLLARGPRFRLDAESLRDQALFLGGDLIDKLGGPSVKPPQPEGLWEAVGFSSSNTVQFVPDSEPEKINRRSLYVFLKRTSPPPEMNTFDAPSRESTCVRRERTNTPLQALLLMNDPQYVSAAQALAARILESPLEKNTAKARLMYRLCTAREANSETATELTDLYKTQLVRYQHDPQAAEELLAIQFGQVDRKKLYKTELAAWTIVANTVLNLDEVVTKN